MFLLALGECLTDLRLCCNYKLKSHFTKQLIVIRCETVESRGPNGIIIRFHCPEMTSVGVILSQRGPLHGEKEERAEIRRL